MKKTTQGDLSKKLLKYGALSAAVMGIADASGQIIYTDIADVTLIPGGNELVNLDIDANGVIDYLVLNYTSIAALLPINPAGTAIDGPNGFIGFAPYYAYPSNLAANVTVDANNNIIGSVGTLNYDVCAYASDWCGGVTDGYVGLVLDIGGATHYGWLRMDLAADRSSLVVKDYAYNAVPGESILTGQQTLGISDNIFNDLSYFVDASKNLNIVSSTPIDDITIYNLLGKEVKQARLNSTRALLSVSDLSSGIYLVRVTAEDQSKTFKILVN